MKARVVVTSGATREPIDSVRYISNMSSGRTGAMICEALAARGFEVTQVAGVDSAQATGIARRETGGFPEERQRRRVIALGFEFDGPRIDRLRAPGRLLRDRWHVSRQREAEGEREQAPHPAIIAPG